MSVASLHRISIPKEKDVVLASPQPSKWASLLAENRLIIGAAPNALEARNGLLGMARDYTRRIGDAESPGGLPENIIATGHQAVWHHCGIWAKNVAACTFAEAVGGRALHIVLDHDISDTSMLLPRRNNDQSWGIQKVDIEPMQRAVPLEFRPVPERNRLKAFINAITEACSGRLCSDIWLSPATLKNVEISRFDNIAELITHLQASLYTALGLGHITYLPVSRLSTGKTFVDFAASIMVDAAGFVAAYNSGVSKQDELRARSSQMNVRPLEIDKKCDLIELPFWLTSPAGLRSAMHVQIGKNNKAKIGTASAMLGYLDSGSPAARSDQLNDILRRRGYRLRPKVISLTLFARMFLTDWFVHGVGGAGYEPVTDHIIDSYYGIKPPAFGVATCTMTLPARHDLAYPGDRPSQLKHRLHNIRHNPERYMCQSVLKTEAVESLVRSKKELITQANDRSLDKERRKSAWNSLFEVNMKLLGYVKETAGALEKKIMQCWTEAKSYDVCSCREYFFGLFPEKRLRRVAESLTFSK